MASFNVAGISELNDLLSKYADVPDNVLSQMLTAMGEVTADAQSSEGRNMNIYDPEWTGTHVVDSLQVKDPKIADGTASVIVTFKGKRKRGNTETRNAEIAFINEFGKDGVAPKPFVKTANEKNIDRIFKAGEAVYDNWIQQNS